jgi:PDZ domain
MLECRSVRLLTMLAFVTGAIAASAQTAPPIVIAAKFDTSTEHVLVPITVGGHEFWCNPDTGFSALIALDDAKAVAAGLSIAPGIPTPDSNPPAAGDRSTTATVVIGGVQFPAHPIIVRKLPEEAPDMDCIMGVALLRRFVVEFDHMTPRLVLHDRAAWRPPDGAEAVPLVFRTNPNVPYVDIELVLAGGGAAVPLRVVPDTGAAFYAAALVGDAAKRVQAELPTVAALTYTDSRVTQLFAARPASVRVGGVSVALPVVAVVEGSLGGGAIADGLLGSGFFRKFTAAFDFDGRMMHLLPNDRLKQPHRYDATGVGFVRRGGRHVVVQVLAGSGGAAAGVRVGDVLLRIDGRDSSDLTPVQLRDLLNVDGATRRLLLERGGQPVTLDIRLKSRI